MGTNSTKDIAPICTLELNRYLGTWYEIARLPHAFEEGLEQVTATYSLKKNGKIQVINSGVKNNQHKTIKGVAWIPDKNCTSRLYVRFFWPFKSEYKVIMLDEKEYHYAVVTSSTTNYLWILCREPEMSEELFSRLVAFAGSKGFAINDLISVKH